MGMNANGNTNQAVSGINVTPLIDVLLVLLIIFMVIVPVTPLGLEALVPQPPRSPDLTIPDAPVVVQVVATPAGPVYKINSDPIAHRSLEPKLTQIFASRQEKQMFGQGDPSVDYAQVAEVIDFAHHAGVDSVGILTPRTSSRR